jgi:hypothetical protein
MRSYSFLAGINHIIGATCRVVTRLAIMPAVHGAAMATASDAAPSYSDIASLYLPIDMQSAPEALFFRPAHPGWQHLLNAETFVGFLPVCSRKTT